jgi:hypothetical protein
MAVSIIDGTLVEASLKTARMNLRIYNHLKFRLADGSEKTVAKSVVDAEVAALLMPGTSGRFYLFTAIDHRGVHGVRTADGRTVFKYPKNNETAMLVVVAMGALLLMLGYAMGGISIWGVLCLLLGVPAYFLYRSVRGSAEQQFNGDGSYRAPAASEPAAT